MAKKKEIQAVTKVEKHWVEPGDYFGKQEEVFFIPIPDEIVEALGWVDEQQIEVEVKNGKIIVTKK